MATQVKIFKASGYDAIQRMEDEVNEWMATLNGEVIAISPSLCTIGVPEEEMYQFMTITVVYGGITAG